VVGGVGLGSSDSAEGDKHGWVDRDAVIEVRANDLLQAGHLGFVELSIGVKIRCIMYFGAVSGLSPLVGCIFMAGWCVVSELVKSGMNIVGYRDVGKFLGVFSFDSEATIKFSFPVGGDGVKVLESFDEVVSIVPAYIFHTKVVNDKAERDVASVVAPETGGSRSWSVTVFGKVGGEANVGNESSLFEAVHSLPNFNVNPPVWGDEVLQ
jgi:hypothetical protein